MKKWIYPVMAISCAALCLFLVGAYAADANRVEEPEEFYNTASEVVEAYYRNRDNNESIDISDIVSEHVGKLLETKIELRRIQKEILKHEFLDYRLEISPIYMDQWDITEDVAHLYVQAEMTWNYAETFEETSVSEVQEVTVRKNEDGTFTVIECYDYGDNLRLGPIDSIFKASEMLHNTDDLQEAINEYKREFSNQYLEKKADR